MPLQMQPQSQIFNYNLFNTPYISNHYNQRLSEESENEYENALMHKHKDKTLFLLMEKQQKMMNKFYDQFKGCDNDYLRAESQKVAEQIRILELDLNPDDRISLKAIKNFQSNNNRYTL